MTRVLVIGLLLATATCASPQGIRDQSRPSMQADTRLEVTAFYDGEVKSAFAAENDESFLGIFSPEITRPMTSQEIRAWAKKFFAENHDVAFHVDALGFEDFGPNRAVVRLTFHVTCKGDGAFRGTELDALEKRDGKWLVVSWEKVDAIDSGGHAP